MKLKTLIGWIAIILISIIPAFLLLLFGPARDLSVYSSLTQTLGQLAGLMGVTMLSLTFILSTRIKFIEDLFGGLDKVYIAHGILGGTALGLILFHPILLVLKFVPSNFNLAAKYLLPSSYWSVNFGIIALISFAVLIYITLYTRIRYHHWKFSHKFLGLVFAFAVIHIFLVRGSASRDLIFNGYYIFATAVSVIGLGGFSYTLFIKSALMQEAFYFIESINGKDGTYEIILVPEGKALEYKSGQFIFVRFYNHKLSREAHPFSIASKSNERKLKIVIKNLGDFTSELNHLKVGDKVSIEGPYGRFNFSNKNLDQVWLAGGMGITPFLGMSEDLKKDKNKVYLFYSARKPEDFISIDNLRLIEKENKKLKVIQWISSQKGQLSISEIEKQIGGLKDKEFYICGPQGFKNSLRNQLIKSKVSKDRINEENFNFI